MDVSGNYLVAGCADRHNIVYNLNADPSKPYKVSLQASPAFDVYRERDSDRAFDLP